MSSVIAIFAYFHLAVSWIFISVENASDRLVQVMYNY